MMIKRLAAMSAALLMFCSLGFAQQSKSDEKVEFRPHWYIQLQGGAGYTVGETSFGDLLSPAGYLSVGYQFHNALGLRLGVGGWQGKGSALLPNGYDNYAIKFGQANLDLTLDMCNLFGDYKHDRVVNPYLLAGVGGLYGFNNEEAAPHAQLLEYYWDGAKMFVAGRFGVGVDFRLGERVKLGLEANANVLSDHFNSKRADNSDWQINALVGLKVNLGKATRESAAYLAALAAAEAEAARLAAEKAAAEAAAEAARLAAEKAAREAAEREALEAARRAAEEKARLRAETCAANSDNIFFTIGSPKIRKSEKVKVEKLAEWLKNNPDFNVAVVGYADEETGTAKGNMELSRKRAHNVRMMLVDLGVAQNRLSMDYKGDTVQPFEEQVKNRVAMCTVE